MNFQASIQIGDQDYVPRGGIIRAILSLLISTYTEKFTAMGQLKSASFTARDHGLARKASLSYSLLGRWLCSLI